MTAVKQIAFRHLRSKHTFGFISFATILSIAGLMLGVAALNIISSFSDGFAQAIQQKLATIDGHVRIQKYSLSSEISITEPEFTDVRQKLDSLSQIKYLIPYIEKRAMIRKGNSTEGVIVYGVPDSALNQIFRLTDFLHEGSSEFAQKDQLIIGAALSELLNNELNAQITLFDLERYLLDKSLKAGKFTVTGIIKTGFAEYDKLLVFMSLDDARNLFDMTDKYSGVIAISESPQDIEILDRAILQVIGSYPFITSTWKERHSTLFAWLNIYDVPVKLVMFFITLIAIFNISSTLWMTIKEKTKDIGILQTIGFSPRKIQNIFLIEGLTIGFLGTILGILLSVIFLFLQLKFRFIALSSEVYFLDYLPVHWSFANLLLYPALALALSVIAAYIPCLRVKNIQPAVAVRYE